MGSAGCRLRHIAGGLDSAATFLEAPTGEIIAHALDKDAPPVVVQAVLAGRVDVLQATSSRRRIIELGLGLPVQQWHLGDAAALVLPITAPGGETLWWWLLVPQPPPEAQLRDGLNRLTRGVTYADRGGSETQRGNLLHGRGVLPAHLQGEDLYVATLRSRHVSSFRLTAALAHWSRAHQPQRAPVAVAHAQTRPTCC